MNISARSALMAGVTTMTASAVVVAPSVQPLPPPKPTIQLAADSSALQPSDPISDYIAQLNAYFPQLIDAAGQRLSSLDGVTPEALAAWFAERGHPGYRARQVLDAAWTGRGGGVLARSSPSRLRSATSSTGASASTPSLDTRGPRRGRRPDREGAPSARRRRAGRVGADALPGAGRRRASGTPCASQPGRVRGRLPVLRDRRARASSATSRPRRSSTRSATRPARLAADGKRLTNVVYMGMGEPLLNLDRVLDVDRRAQRPAPVRPRRAPHHGVDVRRRARDPAPDRARPAVHAGGQPPRRARRAARRARPAQPALASRGGRRGRARPRRGDRPPRDLRGRR